MSPPEQMLADGAQQKTRLRFSSACLFYLAQNVVLDVVSALPCGLGATCAQPWDGQ